MSEPTPGGKEGRESRREEGGGTRDVVAAGVEGGGGGGAFDGSAHTVLIVFTHKHDRQLPQSGDVCSLENLRRTIDRGKGHRPREQGERRGGEGRGGERAAYLALIGRAVAVEREVDAVVLEVLVRERQTGADRHLSADNAVAAVEVALRVVHVHRTAFALSGAAFLRHQLSQNAAGRVTERHLQPTATTRRAPKSVQPKPKRRANLHLKGATKEGKERDIDC